MSAETAGDQARAETIARIDKGHYVAQKALHDVRVGKGRAADLIAKARATLSDPDEIEAFDRSVARAGLAEESARE